MSKLDELRKTAGQNVRDSTGGDRPGLSQPAPSGPPPRWRGVVRSKDSAAIPLDLIEPDPDQPRTEFDPDELGRLAESLKARGQLQPCRVRWDEGRGVYVILVGERRYRAARLAGLATLDCVMVEGAIPADELLAIQLVENALRDDLKPVEQARAYRRLMDARGWSIRQLAAELSIGHSSVDRALTLLDLPAAVQESVEQGGLAPSAAAEIAKIADPAIQGQLASVAMSEGLKRDEVAELVRSVKARRPAPAARPGPVTYDLGDGITAKLTWKKANGIGQLQAAKRLVKAIQERERREPGEAA